MRYMRRGRKAVPAVRSPNPDKKKSKTGPKNPTLPTNLETSGTHDKPSEKAGPLAVRD